MRFNVYNGEYPFDQLIGQVEAETEDAALKAAIRTYGNEYPHPVVSPAASTDSIVKH